MPSYRKLQDTDISGCLAEQLLIRTVADLPEFQKEMGSCLVSCIAFLSARTQKDGNLCLSEGPVQRAVVCNMIDTFYGRWHIGIGYWYMLVGRTCLCGDRLIG